MLYPPCPRDGTQKLEEVQDWGPESVVLALLTSLCADQKTIYPHH